MKVKLNITVIIFLFFTGLFSYGQEHKNIKSVKDIDTVVVVGYIKKKLSNLTGSSVFLKSKDINTPSAISIDQALQGKVPGLTVFSGDGTPGAFHSIRIRGFGSFSAGQEPLFVIDGVPLINNNIRDKLGGGNLGNSLASINNNDIESVTVLKDAASTAIYGARGSNGVIVITTKRGKKGKARFELSSSLGFQNPAVNKLKMLSASDRLNLLTEAISNSFALTKEEGLQRIEKENIGSYNLWDGKEHNWGNLLRVKDAPSYVINLSASGGDEKSSFYTSIGYNKTTPVYLGGSFERISGIFNYNRKLSDRLSFETSFNGSFLSSANMNLNSYSTMLRTSPWVNPYNPDGTYNIGDFQKMTKEKNLFYLKNNDVSWTKQIRGLVKTKLEYKILKSLSFSTNLNIDYVFNDNKNYNNRYYGDGSQTQGGSMRDNLQDFTLTTINQLNFTKRFGKHSINTSLFMEFQKNQTDMLSGSKIKFPADGLTNMENASSKPNISSSLNDWKQVSYFGTINYSYADKYIFDATIRREGSSRFAYGKRYGTFWSGGLVWNMAKEDFVPHFFNDLKLRSSYGITGNNAIINNSYQKILIYDISYDNSQGSHLKNIGNSDLTWEKGKTFDVGLDFSIFKSRINGLIEYYNRKTYDLLMRIPLPYSIGLTNPYQMQNVGEVLNTGVEASLNINVLQSKNFSLSLFGSIATVNNKILKLMRNHKGEPFDISSTGESIQISEEGQPINEWYMRSWAGVDKQTGSPQWYINGINGETTSDYNKAKKVLHGHSAPLYSGNFGVDISYRDIFLNTNFTYSGGNKVYDYMSISISYFKTNQESLAIDNGREELMERWQKPGDITNVPKLNYNEENYFTNISSRHLYNGDFIRLRDITLGYNLPKSIVEQIGMTGCKLTIRGTNLWTYTFDKNLKQDPEMSTNGLLITSTPPVKSIMFGVNLEF